MVSLLCFRSTVLISRYYKLPFLCLLIVVVYTQIAKGLRPIVLGLILCASHARTFSLIHGYSAPIEIYKLLEHHEDVGTGEKPDLAIFSFFTF